MLNRSNPNLDNLSTHPVLSNMRWQAASDKRALFRKIFPRRLTCSYREMLISRARLYISTVKRFSEAGEIFYESASWVSEYCPGFPAREHARNPTFKTCQTLKFVMLLKFAEILNFLKVCCRAKNESFRKKTFEIHILKSKNFL